MTDDKVANCENPPRGVVEEHLRLSVHRFLERFGRPARRSVTGRAAFAVRTKRGIVRFTVAATRQKLGGVRWWFTCPNCERRCEFLYVRRGYGAPSLRCRKCWNLTYRSQRA